ncbi:protein SLOW WALKER 1 [Phoenix dactylifera]|uniref:Protein SLOW WALKER 1 n=1 Tax=Phoenix dactylifera TaxID=42345 RepID=A0A8B7C679_PHODC|nr:protein SLOW WALKER 1 [Phoenix dactylifera]
MAADPSKPLFPVESSHHPKPPSRKPQTLTAESKFWRSFKNSELASGLILPVTALEFSPVPPHDLAAASSAAVYLFDGATLSPKPFSPLSSFSDVAYSPSFRCDGALLAAGGESGIVQVFRLDRAGHALRRLRAHARPVRLVRYPRVADKLHIFSGGDDALLSYWDVPSETQVLSFPGAHHDYIRAGSPSPVSSEVIATGSYDHTVKVWDVRVSSNANPVLGFSHGAPVESVLFLPSGGLLATAGGNCVKIWDVIGGGRLVHTVEGHNKTVTAMCLGRMRNNESSGRGGGESRLMSVSIDGYLKIFDFAAYKITHSMRYPAQLLSVGFSPSGLARVVGTSNGTIYMGKKKMKEKEGDIFGAKVVSEFDTFAPGPVKHVLRPNFRYFRRGQNEKPQETDYIVKRAAKVKLAEYDKLLKEFRHKDALVAALNQKNPNSIVAVMEELVARKKLLKSVVNLDTDELRLLLGFLHKYATMPRYARFLMGLAKRVLELRAEDIRSKDELKGYVRNLKRMIAEEIKIQHSLQEIQGMISPLLVIAGR